MSDFILPTTAGSVVSFEDWGDVEKTEKFRYVVSLIPGHFDSATGEFGDVVWADAYGEDGGMYDVDADRILEGNPTLVFEAPEVNPVNAESLDMADERLYGAIVVLEDSFGEDAVAMFTPGIITDGEISDAEWTNSYGGYFTQAQVAENAKTLLVRGSADL